MVQLRAPVDDAIGAARRPDSLDVVKLVNELFTKPGHQYLFAFNQNIRRTNIQFAELLALLRVHRGYNDPLVPSAELDFTSFEEIKELLTEMATRLNLEEVSQAGKFSALVSDYIANKIIVEPYYGTCSVYLPPHIEIDLAAICGESGYIHSCGHLLLLRNATKARVAEIRQATERAFGLCEPGSKFMLIPYCHEDFSAHDRDKTPFLNSGLDDIKFSISKAFVGGRSFSTVLADLGREYSTNLFIAPGGNYQDTPDLFDEWSGMATRNTIWLIADSALRSNDRFPGEGKFYLMYLQQFRNHNFYHLFDENKPGWASHTTLPHTLAGAMINVARPWLPGDAVSQLVDPFGGSGTVYLEAQKIDRVNAETIDLSLLNAKIVDDNISFFSLRGRRLASVVSELRVAQKALAGSSATPSRSAKEGTALETLERIWDVVSSWRGEAGPNFLDLPSDNVENGLNAVGARLSDRILLYISLRAVARGETEIERGNADWTSFFRRELEKLLESIDNYLRYLKHEADQGSRGRLVLSSGSYSPTVMPRAPRAPETSDLFESRAIRTADARSLVKGRYDAVICDPPYGFNTDEEFWTFGAILREAVGSAIASLKASGGQLLVACPQVSYSGKSLMPFVRGDFLTRDILRMAAEQGRECFMPTFLSMSANLDIRPPYYWVAEKTLRRSILHFWIREKAN